MLLLLLPPVELSLRQVRREALGHAVGGPLHAPRRLNGPVQGPVNLLLLAQYNQTLWLSRNSFTPSLQAYGASKYPRFIVLHMLPMYSAQLGNQNVTVTTDRKSIV